MSNLHQRKREIRKRLTEALRALAGLQRKDKTAQVFYDLACRVDSIGSIDTSRLPTAPDGFVVKHTTVQRFCNIGFDVLCLYQVVSMAVLYYWMYAATGDEQDSRSCGRYLGWIEEYLKAPQTYQVIQGEHLEMYLYPLKGTPEDKPHPPEWLEAGEGETV